LHVVHEIRKKTGIRNNKITTKRLKVNGLKRRKH